jgi:TonB family protein
MRIHKIGVNINDRKRRALKPESKRRWFFTAAVLFMFTLCAPALNAQTLSDSAIQKQLEAKFKKAILVIRNFYSSNDLKYNSEGALISGGEPGSWTLNAYFEPEKIKLSKKNITITGKRVYWVYDGSEHMFRSYRGVTNAKIEIDRSSKRNDPSEILKSLTAVFSKSDELLVNLVPPYWEKIIQDKADSGQDKRELLVIPDITISREQFKFKGRVTFPKVIYSTIPQYTEEARQAQVSGSVVLKTVVDENGNAKVVDVLKPLKAGLNTSAIDAVEKTWKFSPATLDGVPIPYIAIVEVKFSLL